MTYIPKLASYNFQKPKPMPKLLKRKKIKERRRLGVAAACVSLGAFPGRHGTGSSGVGGSLET